ncbi:hypothetical protein BIW11_08121 [Tropilaelaps mercedesae]|uniref:Uncharacterized protein n=1 Tax=Tropilaelaps mercedesae TaxID=418985 RepID=A0A1V9XQZ8_9ACAR|nr:hypothetical protein BIW11_08121 [Tropilaelaps mercedesae]
MGDARVNLNSPVFKYLVANKTDRQDNRATAIVGQLELSDVAGALSAGVGHRLFAVWLGFVGTRLHIGRETNWRNSSMSCARAGGCFVSSVHLLVASRASTVGFEEMTAKMWLLRTMTWS